MIRPTCLLLTSLLALAGCALAPIAETPVESAQRRLPAEPPLLVAEGCLYQRNLFYLNHYLRAESRQLAEDGAREVIAELKQRKIDITRLAVPLMCASELPPRRETREGRISASRDQQSVADKLRFPVPLLDSVEKEPELLAAYSRLFAACDHERYRRERLYECPLLSTAQAALLKTRLKRAYVLALSVAGEQASPGNRGGAAALGLLLGFINIPGDEASARIRLVSLETGALVWSSFEAEFRGVSPADSFSDDIRISEDWTRRMLKPLFEKQR